LIGKTEVDFASFNRDVNGESSAKLKVRCVAGG
jgi:hypothetical protein